MPSVAARGTGMRAVAEQVEQLMQRVHASTVPAGFSFTWANDDNWMPHPVPGIRMKVLALNRRRRYATLLLDVAPGTHFPEHHHGGAEECYVVSGSLHVKHEDGSEGDVTSGNVYRIAPGHDAWVVGNEPAVFVEFQGAANYAKPH